MRQALLQFLVGHTKRDNCYYNMRFARYYKMRQALLQITTQVLKALAQKPF